MKFGKKKQKNTSDLLEKINENPYLIDSLNKLRKEMKVACASNSINKTVDEVLTNLGIKDCFDLILSNEDVDNPKPNPEIYLKALDKFIKSGKIRYIGMSNETPYGLSKYL